jgi:hypothetical protein
MLLKSVDTNNVHGGLLGLSELASSYKAKANLEEERLKVKENSH